MALQKEKELDNGIVGDYWVAEPRINALTKKTDIIMLLFKDKATRDSGKSFLFREGVPGVDSIYLTGKQVYEAIKESRIREETDSETNEIIKIQTNWFFDAIDC